MCEEAKSAVENQNSAWQKPDPLFKNGIPLFTTIRFVKTRFPLVENQNSAFPTPDMLFDNQNSPSPKLDLLSKTWICSCQTADRLFDKFGTRFYDIFN